MSIKNLILLFPILLFSQNTIESKFELPNGFYRPYNDDYSKFLRSFPLKDNNIVYYHDGDIKPNYGLYAAVFDYKIGTKDLHQCADASIYLNSRFKFEENKLDEIAYSFTSGYLFKYKDYLKGIYPKPYQDSNGRWLVEEKQYNERENNFNTFFKYLEILWTWAGTSSIKNLDTYNIDAINVMPGDILVQTGSPFGHSVSIVDVIKNDRGRIMIMLAQSFMPAQQQHILLNPETGNVWYELFSSNQIITPEWKPFNYSDIRRFK